ncbi:TetR/AcrR family transcriptional regulator [Brevibacterium luteolum]|uniref:TetR/AcrR family transcriptional regulator n=1 Tax=Brevibacterium luteolum TaxID=199591 RepID=A0A6G8KVV9_9MICO|nr:TetR/AcrR family transcriptional regulator [Brevibacterium luteolum]MBU8577878.1 TetR/AcrR family transcriptional regulator [Brevibacterium luteolum]QIN28725.1 TetR/AcrR family transcriptional regulator [Brevibacterium luteolum]
MFSEHVQPAAPRRSSTRASAREKTRATVIAAAENLFLAEGYDAVSIRSIARDAQVSVGTVMGVGNKDELLVEVFTSRILARVASRVASPKTSSTLADELAQLFGDYFELLTADDELARAWGIALLRNQGHAATLIELKSTLTKEIEAVSVKHGAGTITADLTDPLYFVYLGALMNWGTGVCSADDAARTLADTIARLLSSIE